jgi:hypothetical protein
MFASINEYARHRGCDKKAVQYAIQRGRIKREPDGSINVEQADIDWERNTNHAQARYGHRTKKAQGAVQSGRTRQRKYAERTAATAAQQLGDPARGAQALSFANARAAREIYEAKLKKIDLEERQGMLLPKARVQIEVNNQFRILRDGMLNIPNRLAAQLAAESDPTMVHDLIEEEMRNVLNDFNVGKLR